MLGWSFYIIRLSVAFLIHVIHYLCQYIKSINILNKQIKIYQETFSSFQSVVKIGKFSLELISIVNCKNPTFLHLGYFNTSAEHYKASDKMVFPYPKLVSEEFCVYLHTYRLHINMDVHTYMYIQYSTYT